VNRLFHFVQTANGARASDRIVIGFPKSDAAFEHRASLGVVFRTGRRFGSMPEPPARRPSGTITVLSLSPVEDDHAVLRQSFRDSSLTLYPNCRLTLQPSATLASTLAALRQRRIPIVLCDGDENPLAWREILQATQGLSAPPCVIVASRVADDRLWAEVLNSGGFDVLSKPFTQADVIRVIHSAWVHWRNRYGLTDPEGEFEKPATGR
jgi:CheY-like chemotaxis protein